MDRPLVLESSILKVPVRRADTVERKMPPTNFTLEYYKLELVDSISNPGRCRHRRRAELGGAGRSWAELGEPERREADESPGENPRKRD